MMNNRNEILLNREKHFDHHRIESDNRHLKQIQCQKSQIKQNKLNIRIRSDSIKVIAKSAPSSAL